MAGWGRTARFIEPSSSPSSSSSTEKAKRPPSESDRQWGHKSDLPAFLDPRTATSGGAKKTRSQILAELAGEPTGASGEAVLPIPNGFGGFIIEHVEPAASTRRHQHDLVLSAALAAQSVTAGSSGDSQPHRGTISMAEHCRIVNSALAQKTADLLAVYRAKIASEARMMEQDYYFSASRERIDLQKVIGSYQNKLTEISHQFSSLSSVQSRIHSLKLANASLRVFNLELARNYDAELQDMKLECSLLSSQSSPPLGQIHALEKHIAMKEAERKQLERECEEIKLALEQQGLMLTAEQQQQHGGKAPSSTSQQQNEKSTAHGRSNSKYNDVAEQLQHSHSHLEQELQSTRSRYGALSSQLRNFQQQKQTDYAAQKDEIRRLQAQIGGKLQANMSLQNRVEKLRKSTLSTRSKLSSSEHQLSQAQEAYEREVERGVVELEQLQKDLTSAASGFNEHFLLIQNAIEVCASIESAIKIDLLCRHCMQLLTNPVILWPCGHTLCWDCVTKTELDGSPWKKRPAKPAAETNKYLASSSASSSGSALPNKNGGDAGARYIVICTECKYNFDHPLTTEQALEDAESDDIAFPNPYFDPPANFTGRFYCVPNLMIARLVEAYLSCEARLQQMIPKFRASAKTTDVFAEYLSQGSGRSGNGHRAAAAAGGGARGEEQRKLITAQANSVTPGVTFREDAHEEKAKRKVDHIHPSSPTSAATRLDYEEQKHQPSAWSSEQGGVDQPSYGGSAASSARTSTQTSARSSTQTSARSSLQAGSRPLSGNQV